MRLLSNMICALTLERVVASKPLMSRGPSMMTTSNETQGDDLSQDYEGPMLDFESDEDLMSEEEME